MCLFHMEVWQYIAKSIFWVDNSILPLTSFDFLKMYPVHPQMVLSFIKTNVLHLQISMILEVRCHITISLCDVKAN